MIMSFRIPIAHFVYDGTSDSQLSVCFPCYNRIPLVNYTREEIAVMLLEYWKMLLRLYLENFERISCVSLRFLT